MGPAQGTRRTAKARSGGGAVSLLVIGLLWTPSGCDKGGGRSLPAERARPCKRAEVGWRVDTPASGLRRAGISTRPSGYAEALVPLIPGAVHGWIRACQRRKRWRCDTPAVVWFRVDGAGRVTATGAESACPAVRCLLPRVKTLRIPASLLPDDAQVCLYLHPSPGP